MLDAASDAVIEHYRRVPNEVDATDLDDFADASAEIIQRWMPDTELGPYGKALMSACFVVGGKWVGAPKLPPRAMGPVTAPGVVTTTNTPQPQPPAMRPPPPDEQASATTQNGVL